MVTDHRSAQSDESVVHAYGFRIAAGTTRDTHPDTG